MAANLHEHP